MDTQKRNRLFKKRDTYDSNLNGHAIEEKRNLLLQTN